MSDAIETAILKIHGLDCAEEVAALKSVLLPLAGVKQLRFDVLNGKMTVDYAPQAMSASDLIDAVARTGMRAQPWRDAQVDSNRPAGWARWGRTTLTSASGLLILAGFVVHAISHGLSTAISGHATTTMPLVVRCLYSLATIAGAWYVAPKGWRALVRLRPDMNLLMVVAIIGAMGIGEFLEAATVAFLFALSLLLESWSVGRARRAIAALMSLTPPRARIICPKDHCEEMVPVERIAVGTTVIVKPGEKFPLDGRITTGQTTVNQAPITGESMPVPKRIGDEVFAGTINEDGAIEFATSRPAQDTTLARIIRMVGDAQSKRSPAEQWVERFAHYYTPAVMLLAVAVMLLPPLWLGGAWSNWFYQGLVLLVIGCPCALVISTPVSIVAALTSAARHGILVKGGAFVELPARLKAVALDKTGTLTEGQPRVRQVIPLSGHTEREVLALAAAIELRSEHPLARAIVRYARAQGITPVAAESYQAIKGKGATATVGSTAVWIGSHRYLMERGQETPEIREQLERLSTEASLVVVGKNEHICGLIAIADAVRSHARQAVADLKSAGVRHVVMLTGDNRQTAEAVARETGVDAVRAELLPEDKVAAVEELVRRYGCVAMVGDGVNDAPAMARANLGIAMGAAGTDAALETADIVLMSDDVSRLPWLVHHSHRTLGIIGQNIGGSLGVKVLFVVLTFTGHASLWAAIAADMGVSLLVVFNALRLLSSRTARPTTRC